MRRAFTAAVMLAALLAGSAASAQGSSLASQAASIERGRSLARRDCAMCHATGETGDSPNALSPPFRDLGKRYAFETLAAALADGMLIHHPLMPELHLKPSEISDLISYLKSIQSTTDERQGTPNQPIVPR